MFKKVFSRKSTTSKLPASESTRSDLPPAPTQQRTEEQPSTVPTYAFADKQKGAADTTADSHDKEDESISHAQGQDKNEDKQAVTASKLTRPTRKTKENEASTQPATLAAPVSDGPYLPYWNLENDVTFEDEIYELTSYWTPNFISISEALQAGSKFARENRIMLKNQPEFIDYAVYCYYATLFYIQILRAQRDSGKIDGINSSFLRRFERRFPSEMLPITDFLVPHFSCITSLLLPDSRHGWIVPQYGSIAQDADGNEFNHLFFQADGTTAQTFRTFTSPTGVCLLQPIVPYMVAVLRNVTSPKSKIWTTLTAHQLYDATGQTNYSDNDYPFWTDKDQFLPLSLNTTQEDGTYANIITRRFSRASMTLNNNNQHDEFARLISSPGLNVPVESTPDGMEIASKYWDRTAFNSEINVYAVNTTRVADRTTIQHNAVIGDNPTFRSLEDFLLMPKSSNLDWFEALIDNAATHARFFNGVTNLSHIPTTSGQTPAILTKFVKMTGGRFGQRNTADAELTTINRTLRGDWYFDSLRRTITATAQGKQQLHASFTTSRAAPLRSEELQTLSFGINASIPYTIPDADNVQQCIGAAIPTFRSGSFFEQDNFVRRSAAAASPSAAKAMYKGWTIMIQNSFARARPEGY